MSASDAMAYAAREPGWPGYVAVMIDDAKHKKETAKEVAVWIRQGWAVDHVTRDVAVAGLGENMEERKRRRSGNVAAAVADKLTLFGAA